MPCNLYLRSHVRIGRFLFVVVPIDIHPPPPAAHADADSVRCGRPNTLTLDRRLSQHSPTHRYACALVFVRTVCPRGGVWCVLLFV